MAELQPDAAVTIEPGARHAAGRAARALGRAGPVLFVADPGLLATGLVADVEAALSAAGLGVERFTDFTGDPTIAQVDQAADRARGAKAGLVVALGGGSALDLAKAVAGIAGAPHSAEAYQLCARDFPAERLPIIALPTTSGTGSEATRTAILTRADKAKVWLWGEALRPDFVLIDPETTLSLPPGLTAATGIDAFIHALEAATNANAREVSPADAHAAMRLAFFALDRATHHGADLEARTAMARAAYLGGRAIDAAGTAMGHNIGHALGSLAPIHHGRAVAIGIAATLAWNIAADDGRFAAAARAIGLDHAEDLPRAFGDLLAALGLPATTREAGLAIDPAILAAQMARPENAAMRNSNFRPVTETDLWDCAARAVG